MAIHRYTAILIYTANQLKDEQTIAVHVDNIDCHVLLWQHTYALATYNQRSYVLYKKTVHNIEHPHHVVLLGNAITARVQAHSRI
jgi:hypothetical protein